MAGSIKWFLYSTDGGRQFAIELDESNTEAINGSDNDYVDGSAITFAIPKNLTPRTAYYENADKTRTIRCVALTQTVYNDLVANQRTIPDPIDSNETLTLTRIRPEVIRLPFPQDTGLDDGDDT